MDKNFRGLKLKQTGQVLKVIQVMVGFPLSLSAELLRCPAIKKNCHEGENDIRSPCCQHRVKITFSRKCKRKFIHHDKDRGQDDTEGNMQTTSSPGFARSDNRSHYRKQNNRNGRCVSPETFDPVIV